MAASNNAPLIRTLRQISRNKNASPEVRVRCCELLVLIDPNISFNSFENCNLDAALLAASRIQPNTSSQVHKTRHNGGISAEEAARAGGDGWMVREP